MRDEEDEIDRPNPPLARKRDRAYLGVVYQIRDQKEAGDTKRSHHAHLMGRHFFPADIEIPDREEQGARRVEQGVDGRKGGDTIFTPYVPLMAKQDESDPHEDEKRDETDPEQKPAVSPLCIAIDPPAIKNHEYQS